MSEIQCPLCFATLEVCDVAPCFACGHDPVELDHLAAGRHEYLIYRYGEDLEITLCENCLFDMPSYDPQWFGLRDSNQLDPGRFSMLETVREPVAGRDKWCRSCNNRLAFLRFVAAVRERASL